MSDSLAPLHFFETCVERPWGGRRLESLYGKKLPSGRPIGEIWLISDHPLRESRVQSGPQQGRTLHELLAADSSALLGRLPRLTRSGRFPLLLKLIDVADWLSVQVHPSDEDAERLGELDGGKTEMWHVLACEDNAEILCGADFEPASPPVGRDWLDRLQRYVPSGGDSFFVPPGIVHAIGPGVVLTEIQQTSDVTYRLFDWDRGVAAGRPLHLDKAAEVVRCDGAYGPIGAVELDRDRTLVCACAKFAAERITVRGAWSRQTRRDSFHIVLNIGTAPLKIEADGAESELRPGAAALIPGANDRFSLRGDGLALDYYVPNLEVDIFGPLRDLGLAPEQIKALGCDEPEHRP